MSTRSSQVHTIIHSAAASAAAAGAGVAQIPGSDNAVITPSQIAMIMAIGSVYGKNLDRAAALSILATASAGIIGRTVAQGLVGWIPIAGNIINAGTAATITEAIGWAANKIISD